MSAPDAIGAVANIARVVGREGRSGIVAIRGTFADESEHLQNLCSLFGAETIKASARKCFPTFQETINAFAAHGFRVADKSVVEMGRAQTRREYVETCLDRGGSALFRNMPEADFARGVANADRWAAQAPGDGPIMTAHTLVILERPPAYAARLR
ncbi:MAG: hypothetical protein HOQ05_06030 [Corynebacteriales bacterium]|nr:hypothetical protein [Mycobacteriales bacterium]